MTAHRQATTRTLAIMGCLVVVAGVSACVPAVQQSQRQFPVDVKDDPYKSDIYYEGPYITLQEDKSLLGFPMGTGKKSLLRSWKNRNTAALRHQLYIDITYDSLGWRYYNSATLKGGEPAEFVSIDRKVGDCGPTTGVCGFEEIFGVNLSDAWLRSTAATGMSVEVHSQSGHDDRFSVGADYLSKYLATVDGRLQ